MGVTDRFSLSRTVPAAAKMVNELANPKYVSKDKAIPRKLLQNCRGIAFITVYKAGLFFLGGNLGGGCVIVKVDDPSAPGGFRWSAPLSVTVGGLGGGFIFGGEKISSVIILNTQGAIDGFLGTGQISFGGSASLAAGPVGREAAAKVGLSDNKSLVPAYSYSIAKGAYIGATLEGAVLKVMDDENKSFYGRQDVTSEMILKGQVQPPLLCEELYKALDQSLKESSRDVVDGSHLAASGKELLKQGLVESGEGDLPPGWQMLYTSDGKPYYFDSKTNTTTWDRPKAPIPPRPTPPPPPPATLPAGWQELKTPEGKPYYYNTATNTTQWERP